MEYFINGKYREITYKKRKVDTLAYLDGVLLCGLFRVNNKWTVVINGTSRNQKEGLLSVEGFQTRWYCVKYALRLLGYITGTD